jgi:hypothetical protein
VAGERTEKAILLREQKMSGVRDKAMSEQVFISDKKGFLLNLKSSGEAIEDL